MPRGHVIRVFLGIPEPFVRRAQYVFDCFGDNWGVPVAVSSVPSPVVDVSYSSGSPDSCGSVVHIPFDASLYDARSRCTAAVHDGFHVWTRPGVGVLEADIVGSSYRLLTLLDEQQVAPEARDRRGIFAAEALPLSRRRLADVPIADEQASWLLAQIERARGGPIRERVSKWPSGKRYAIAVTHDTDAISLGAGRELATNLAKSVFRRDRAHARMFAEGLRYIGRPMANPLFGFPRWRDFERFRELRTAFYLFAKVGSLRTDLNDCKSSVVEQRIDWDVLRDMGADGWEFGLHAPIHAKDHLDAFVASKAWLEDKLGTPVRGLRHHYWALDWRSPQTTFAKHVQSGFHYDTSIAWKDIAGFRPGTCHPYRPYDPDRDVPLDLYELPACVMDGHVVREDNDLHGAVQTALATVARVRKHGGVAVLNWHTESACADYIYKRHVATLDRILAALLAAGDAWLATPSDIVEHWRSRSRARLADGSPDAVDRRGEQRLDRL